MNPQTYYQRGTVTVAANSAMVTGANTGWLSNDGLKPIAGCQFTIDKAHYYTIKSVDSDTQLTLTILYAGRTVGPTSYAVLLDRDVPTTDEQNADILLLIKQAEDYSKDSANSAMESGIYSANAKGHSDTAKEQADLALDYANAAHLSELAVTGAIADSRRYSELSKTHADASLVSAVESASQVVLGQQAAATSALHSATAGLETAAAEQHKLAAEVAEKDAVHAKEIAIKAADSAFYNAGYAKQQADLAKKYADMAASSEAHSEQAQYYSTLAEQAATRAELALAGLNTQVTDVQNIHDDVVVLEGQARRSAGIAQTAEKHAKKTVVIVDGYADQAHHSASLASQHAAGASDSLAAATLIKTHVDDAKVAAESSETNAKTAEASAIKHAGNAKLSQDHAIAQAIECESLKDTCATTLADTVLVKESVEKGIIDNSKNMMVIQQYIVHLHGYKV